MRSQNIKKMTKTALILAVLVLVFSLNATFLRAMSCEMGLGLCMVDKIWAPDYALYYCGIGYFFCKKYVER